jgi:hypothetical protein
MLSDTRDDGIGTVRYATGLLAKGTVPNSFEEGNPLPGRNLSVTINDHNAQSQIFDLLT